MAWLTHRGTILRTSQNCFGYGGGGVGGSFMVLWGMLSETLTLFKIIWTRYSPLNVDGEDLLSQGR